MAIPPGTGALARRLVVPVERRKVEIPERRDITRMLWTKLFYPGNTILMNPKSSAAYIAFDGDRRIASGELRDVVRAAKEALNLIDVQRVNSSYRMEQGFTFELNLAGVSDEHRDAFAGTAKGGKA